MGTRVAAIAYEGIRLFHLSVPCLIFGEDRTDAGMPSVDFRICAETPNVVLQTGSGLGLVAPFGLYDVMDADIVIMPSWRSADTPVPELLIETLQKAHARGAIIVGLCLGAFPLAAAGLLAGKSATTHWQVASQLAGRYPDVCVLADQLYVDEGDVVTSAGVAAGLDCCLHLVRRCFGADAAQSLARRIVLSPHRQGGQAQYIEMPVLTTERADGLSNVMTYVSQTLQLPHDLDSVAARAGMTRRTFTRHFQARTGTTFARWLIGQRLILAQQMLEESGHGIEDVASFCGFGTATSLRQHFCASLNTTPSRYRREFSVRSKD